MFVLFFAALALSPLDPPFVLALLYGGAVRLVIGYSRRFAEAGNVFLLVFLGWPLLSTLFFRVDVFGPELGVAASIGQIFVLLAGFGLADVVCEVSRRKPDAELE